MLSTIEKNTTDKLRGEHRGYVAAIDAALSSLKIALASEKDFRRQCQLESPEYYGNSPSLKWPIQMTTNDKKPCELGNTWRAWVRRCGLLEFEKGA